MDAASQSNTALIVAVTLVALGIGGYYFYSSMGCNNSVHAESKTPKQDSTATGTGSSGGEERKKEAKPKFPNGKISIFFGSQTGTAEGFARTLMDEGKKNGFDAKTVDLEEFDPDSLKETELALFLLATYGEGEPTDNAARFVAWLKNTDGEVPNDFLIKMKFSVFGLGNRQYEHYNRMGKLVNAKLEELGGNRVYAYGEGDDDGTLEEDFENWKANLWSSLLQTVGGQTPLALSLSGNNLAGLTHALPLISHEYSLSILSMNKENEARPAERSNVSASIVRSSAPSSKIQSSNKHLFPHHSPRARVLSVRELRNTTFSHPALALGKEGVGSTLHVELDLGEIGLSYETADNLAIVPENDGGLVERLAAHLGYDLDQVVDFQPLPGSSDFKLPFPSPISVRDLLTQCIDLQGPIRHGLAKTLLGYLSDDQQKAWLADLLSPSQRAKFKNVLEEERRGVADLLLNELSSAKPPLLDLLHLLPVIQPRFYTISSSAALSPRVVHITVGITEYMTKGRNAVFAGLTSALLSKSQAGTSSLRVFVRASTFRLPRSLSTPVIMVGPGTGIAPMRALALERGFQRQQSPAQPYGATVLFFGCKYAQMDFIYRDELEALAGEGVLTELHTAFSRDSDKKVYVQDLIASPSQAEKLVAWIEQGAFIFVCGATAMGTDVMNAFVKILSEKQGVSVEKAQAKVKEMQEQGRYVQELWTA